MVTPGTIGLDYQRQLAELCERFSRAQQSQCADQIRNANRAAPIRLVAAVTLTSLMAGAMAALAAIISFS